MRYAFLLCVLLGCAAPVLAHQDDVPINSAADLREWCRMESEAKFIGAGQKATNWVASHIEDGNAFRVEGSWRVDGKDTQVLCRAARGAQQRYATLQVGVTP